MEAIHPSVTVQVGGEPVALLLDLNAMIQYRDTFGRDIFADMGRIAAIGAQAREAEKNGNVEPPGVTDALEQMANLLWATMLDARPNITVREVRKIIPRAGSEEYVELFAGVMEAIRRGMPEPARPTKAAPKIVASRKK